MRATDILMAEHRVIERVLGALESACVRLEAGEEVESAFFADAVTFIREFADGCHHRKEEGVLFPAMHAAGLPMESGPLAVMLHEHDQGRRYARGISDAASRLGEKDDAARDDLVRHARGYIRLLHEHIAKEDNVLFPMAAQLLTGQRGETVSDEVARVQEEEGVHDEFVRLAEQLVARADKTN